MARKKNKSKWEWASKCIYVTPRQKRWIESHSRKYSYTTDLIDIMIWAYERDNKVAPLQSEKSPMQNGNPI